MDAPLTPASPSACRRWRAAWSAARALLAVLLPAVALGACGSDGATTAEGGIGGTGISAASRIGYGPITALGSIYVNGVRYAIDDATITKGGVGISGRDLRVGMTVEVRGEAVNDTEAIAETVIVEEALGGMVEAKAADHLIVLGQTVLISEATRFGSDVPDLEAIDAGYPVEVYGLVQAPGVIEATLIRGRAPKDMFTVRGLVGTHDTGAATFTLGALTVDYGAAETTAMPPGNWQGLVVKAKGGACSAIPACGALSVLEVKPERLGAAEAGRAEVEAFVTAMNGSTRFRIGNQTVVVGPATQFSGGAPADIGPGAKLEVEGVLAGGVLYAAEIKFRHSARVVATVAAADPVAGTIALLELPVVTVSVNGRTHFRGSFHGLRDIAPGDRIEVRGYAGANGAVIAADIRDEHSPNADIVLQGPVLAVAFPQLMILGATVDAGAVQNFRDARHRDVDAASFFDMLEVGAVIKASGERGPANRVVWEQIEILSPASDGALRQARARSP